MKPTTVVSDPSEDDVEVFTPNLIEKVLIMTFGDVANQERASTGMLLSAASAAAADRQLSQHEFSCASSLYRLFRDHTRYLATPGVSSIGQRLLSLHGKVRWGGSQSNNYESV